MRRSEIWPKKPRRTKTATVLPPATLSAYLPRTLDISGSRARYWQDADESKSSYISASNPYNFPATILASYADPGCPRCHAAWIGFSSKKVIYACGTSVKYTGVPPGGHYRLKYTCTGLEVNPSGEIPSDPGCSLPEPMQNGG